MKHTSKHNDGFTLVELVVAIAISVIVTAAATSVLLMGLRINRQTSNTASQMMTVRSLLSAMEDVAATGNVQTVISQYGSWALYDQPPEDIEAADESNQPTPVFSYNSVDQTILTNGVVVLRDVKMSHAVLDDQVLSVVVATADGIYSTSIYCRMQVDDSTEAVSMGTRESFLTILQSQYRSRGEIRNGADEYTYYSEWYIGMNYDENGYDEKWNADTPWCACYISWALDQIGLQGPAGYCPKNQASHKHGNWFADVDEFKEYFQDNGKSESEWYDSVAHEGTYIPIAGDLIFFDWDKGTDAEHVGVVLKTDDHRVYTIEGNNAGRVRVCSYPLTDQRIIGYGVLPWTNTNTQ